MIESPERVNARIAVALERLEHAAHQLRDRHTAGDLEPMDALELDARRSLALVRQLLPRAGRPAAHRRTATRPPAVDRAPLDRVTAAYS